MDPDHRRCFRHPEDDPEVVEAEVDEAPDELDQAVLPDEAACTAQQQLAVVGPGVVRPRGGPHSFYIFVFGGGNNKHVELRFGESTKLTTATDHRTSGLVGY